MSQISLLKHQIKFHDQQISCYKLSLKNDLQSFSSQIAAYIKKPQFYIFMILSYYAAGKLVKPISRKINASFKTLAKFSLAFVPKIVQYILIHKTS